MVIEWLKFHVSPQLREQFIQRDREIWTAALSNYPGFLGKEIWIDPNLPQVVVLVIRWKSRQHWNSVPATILEATEKTFAQVMGENTYEMVETGEYQVRQFPAHSLKDAY